MAIVVSFSVTSVGPTVANSVINGIVSVQNTEAGSVTVRDIRIAEIPSAALTSPASQTPQTWGAIIRQPDFLVPNAAPGTYPTLTTTSTGYYPFSVVSPSPNFPGASPNAPNALRNPAMPPNTSILNLSCVAVCNDGSSNIVGSAMLQIPLISAVKTYPLATSGTEQFNVQGNAVNWFFF